MRTKSRPLSGRRTRGFGRSVSVHRCMHLHKEREREFVCEWLCARMPSCIEHKQRTVQLRSYLSGKHHSARVIPEHNRCVL